MPCSPIICDIDHFKKINDVHGHQAGDSALAVFAATLKQHARGGDFVARYGGEEFVILWRIATIPQDRRAGGHAEEHRGNNATLNWEMAPSPPSSG